MSFLDRIRKAGAPAPGAHTDRFVLRQLEELGADLTQPRHVTHFLYFANESDARGAADVIEKAGYQLTVTPPDENIAQWSTRAETARVVDATTVEAFRTWFEQIATEFRGEYDGWEAAAQP